MEQPEQPGNSHPGGQGQGQRRCPPYNKGQGWPPPLSQLHMVARALWQSLMRVFLWKGSALLLGESGRGALNQWSAESQPRAAERASAPASRHQVQSGAVSILGSLPSSPVPCASPGETTTLLSDSGVLVYRFYRDHEKCRRELLSLQLSKARLDGAPLGDGVLSLQGEKARGLRNCCELEISSL